MLITFSSNDLSLRLLKIEQKCTIASFFLKLVQMVSSQPRSQGSFLPVPTERESERPWLGMVTWLQKKTNFEGGVLCLLIFFSRSQNDRKGPR